MKRVENIENRRYIEKRSALQVSYLSFSSRVPNIVLVGCCPTYWGINHQGEKYIVDILALTSPYLSQLPAFRWRVGHAERRIPTDMEAWVVGVSASLTDPRVNALFSDVRHVVRENLFSWDRMKKIAKINFYDYKIDYSSKRYKNQPRFSRFHPSLQQKASLVDLPSVDKKTWYSNGGKRWYSYNITQSVSIPLERGSIRKVSFPVSDIKEYSWSLYDGSTKIYEESYTTDKYLSFHTFTLSKAMIADRLEIIVKKGGVYRRIARPVLE